MFFLKSNSICATTIQFSVWKECLRHFFITIVYSKTLSTKHTGKRWEGKSIAISTDATTFRFRIYALVLKALLGECH